MQKLTDSQVIAYSESLVTILKDDMFDFTKPLVQDGITKGDFSKLMQLTLVQVFGALVIGMYEDGVMGAGDIRQLLIHITESLKDACIKIDEEKAANKS